MSGALLIARREWFAYLRSPLGAVVIAGALPPEKNSRGWGSKVSSMLGRAVDCRNPVEQLKVKPGIKYPVKRMIILSHGTGQILGLNMGSAQDRNIHPFCHIGGIPGHKKGKDHMYEISSLVSLPVLPVLAHAHTKFEAHTFKRFPDPGQIHALNLG